VDSRAGARFWSKVRKTETCWLWQGARTGAGWHGVFAIDATRRGRRMVVAHRVSWEDAYGSVPPGLEVLHSCDEPACVRPDHLFLGTQRANMIDAGRKGRLGTTGNATHCKRGHPFEGNTYIHPTTGRRQCRVCVGIRNARRAVRATVTAGVAEAIADVLRQESAQ
jgi:hypothetical protein